ncbi:MAG: hypothetical protein IPG50_28300 [Myxococcales bacterium]|nr:hypothetical protein [Myxococcales bacterium]
MNHRATAKVEKEEHEDLAEPDVDGGGDLRGGGLGRDAAADERRLELVNGARLRTRRGREVGKTGDSGMSSSPVTPGRTCTSHELFVAPLYTNGPALDPSTPRALRSVELCVSSDDVYKDHGPSPLDP